MSSDHHCFPEITLIALLFTGTVAFADHWTSPQDVSRAAHELAEQTEHFHRVIHQLTGYSHLANDSHRLSENAEHFHIVVEEGASYDHVLNDYHELKSSFRHLKRQFEHAHSIHHNPHVQMDFDHVRFAFRALKRAMGDSSYDDEHGTGHMYVCRAVDRGHEEHFLQPHLGVDYTLFGAQRAAIRECQRYHRRCVISRCDIR